MKIYRIMSHEKLPYIQIGDSFSGEISYWKKKKGKNERKG
jgi:hypothetical protein